MKYKIDGGQFPVLLCSLSIGDTMLSEAGGMSWMSANIEMKTSTGGGITKSIGRLFTGESLFINEYTARADNQLIAFASSYPGKILDIKIEPGRGIIAQKDAFLAMEPSVQLSTHFNRSIEAGFFGGEGFILQRFSGNGMAFMEVHGALMEYSLEPNQVIYIDQGHLAAMEESVAFELETVKGVKNVLFGGEGLFVGSLRGPGKVWIQTMPFRKLMAKITPRVSK